MLAINNTEKFNEIVTEARTKSANFKRWQNAINKAVVQIELQPEFITWMPETKSLLIWSQESNEIHSANGICDCIAFTKGFPCWHRGLARLVRIYMESEEEDSQICGAAAQTETKELPYLRPRKQAVRVENYGGVKILSY
jgi:hypothetical protein